MIIVFWSTLKADHLRHPDVAPGAARHPASWADTGRHELIAYATDAGASWEVLGGEHAEGTGRPDRLAGGPADDLEDARHQALAAAFRLER